MRAEATAKVEESLGAATLACVKGNLADPALERLQTAEPDAASYVSLLVAEPDTITYDAPKILIFLLVL